MAWVISSLPDKAYSGEAVPLLEVDGRRGVARLYPHHGGLNLRRRTEVVLPNLQAPKISYPEDQNRQIICKRIIL
jgi:hypothetical protein